MVSFTYLLANNLTDRQSGRPGLDIVDNTLNTTGRCLSQRRGWYRDNDYVWWLNSATVRGTKVASQTDFSGGRSIPNGFRFCRTNWSNRS
jgi:hypothetical protein